MMNTNANYTIEQVYQVDDSLAMDCYYIASESVGDADGFVYTVPEHVNVLRQPLLIARRNDYVVGFCMMRINANAGAAHLAALYVTKGEKRRGLGRQMLTKMESLARAANVREMSLMSRPGAIGFYEKLGYMRLKPGQIRCAAYSASMYKTL